MSNMASNPSPPTSVAGSKVCAVISISEFDESCEQAVASILENPSYFDQLLLVKQGFSSLTEPYKGFQADVGELEKLGINVSWQSQLNVAACKARAIVRLEPDVRVTDGAIKTLIDDMLEQSDSKDHFAVSSILILDTEKSPPLVESMSYGFLLVIMMLDSFRSLFAMFRYNRTVDLRGQLLSISFPNRVRLAPNRWWAWWIGTGICRTRYGGSAAIQMPDEKDQGVSFVLRTIKTHNHMGIGIWMLFFFIYYALFAFPIWNWFLSPHSMLGRWLVRDMTALYWLIPYILHTALVAIVAWWSAEFPKTYVPFAGYRGLLLPIQVLLYTFYLTASPLVLVYGRFHLSRAAWASATAAFKRRGIIKKNN